MRQLYRIEDTLWDSRPAERRLGHRAKVPQIRPAMKRCAQALKADPHFLPPSSLGKDLTYFLEKYSPMVDFICASVTSG